MAGVIDMAKFTFSDEEVRSMGEMMFDEVIKGGDVSKFHQIWTDIIMDKEVGFVGKAGMIGVAGQKCNATKQVFTVGTRKMTWTPKDWMVFIGQCFSELESIAAVYELKTGVEISDFSDTHYQSIVLEKFLEALNDMVWRYIWFGDIAAKNVTDGGIITDGIDVKYFTVLDGFFKQMIAQGIVTPKQRVTITENAAATYVLQELTAAKAKEYLAKVFKQAPILLKRSSDLVLYVTQSVYDAYKESLGNVGSCCTEAGREAEIKGVLLVQFNGVTLQPIDVWDEMINEYENTTAKLNNPHRIVLTTKGVLAVGVDSNTSFADYKTWYNVDTEEVNTRSRGKLDAKLANPELFVIAI